MNSRVQFWVLLFAVNLAGWLVVSRTRVPGRGTASESPSTETNSSPARSKAVPPIVIRTNAFNWAQLESEDYPTYIKRLRSIGCPEQTIRDIVIADLEKLMAPEVKQVEGRHEPPKFWEPKAFTRAVDSLEKAGKKQEIDFRKRAIVQELLGIDLAAERSRTKGEVDSYADRLSFLPPEKQAEVRMAMEKANNEEAVLRESSWLDQDQLTPEERQRIREIQKRKEEQIAAVLTPEEYERYQLWFSPSAYRVRDFFLALEPNEHDFLALYEIQRQFDAQWNEVDPSLLSPAEKVSYDIAQKDYEQKIRTYLGPERYEQFLATREPDFQQLEDTIAQFGLNRETAAKIYSFKRVLTEERSRIEANAAVTPEERQQVLQALSEETEQAVVDTLGPRAYRYYLRTGAGKWISQP